LLYLFGLGSNVGDKLINLKEALRRLQGLGKLETFSSVYESKALLPIGAPPAWDMNFFNMAALVKINLAPLDVLSAIKNIEKELGRDMTSATWSPRVIDIDILLVEEMVMNTTLIQIPHKELHKRNFALVPAAEIAPNMVHPLFKPTLQELAAAVVKEGLQRVCSFRI
jgi:2-amino-4-hydroxy-6-hydroxymethyldihydropteridine diphosphokinase